jgi:hypothetical protein
MYLGTAASGVLVWTWRTSDFHTMQEISWLNKQLDYTTGQNFSTWTLLCKMISYESHNRDSLRDRGPDVSQSGLCLREGQCSYSSYLQCQQDEELSSHFRLRLMVWCLDTEESLPLSLKYLFRWWSFLMPFIPAKSYACMSTSWPPGNVLGWLSHARAKREFPTRKSEHTN